MLRNVAARARSRRVRAIGVAGTLYDANVRAWRLAESARETQRHEAPGTELRLGKPATVPIRWGIARRAPVQGAMRRCVPTPGVADLARPVGAQPQRGKRTRAAWSRDPCRARSVRSPARDSAAIVSMTSQTED